MLTLYRRPLTARYATEFPIPFTPRFSAHSPSPSTSFGAARRASTDDGWRFEFDVPGARPANVSVSITEGVLTIEAERGDGDHAQRLSRQLSLPAGIDADGVAAQLRDGVLTVTVTNPPKPVPERIEISVTTSEPEPEPEAIEAATDGAEA